MKTRPPSQLPGKTLKQVGNLNTLHRDKTTSQHGLTHCWTQNTTLNFSTDGGVKRLKR